MAVSIVIDVIENFSGVVDAIIGTVVEDLRDIIEMVMNDLRAITGEDYVTKGSQN